MYLDNIDNTIWTMNYSLVDDENPTSGGVSVSAELPGSHRNHLAGMYGIMFSQSVQHLLVCSNDDLTHHDSISEYGRICTSFMGLFCIFNLWFSLSFSLLNSG